ncbi:hypothetical protein THO17_22100 [Marinomonas sp. THO17]
MWVDKVLVDIVEFHFCCKSPKHGSYNGVIQDKLSVFSESLPCDDMSLQGGATILAVGYKW